MLEDFDTNFRRWKFRKKRLFFLHYVTRANGASRFIPSRMEFFFFSLGKGGRSLGSVIALYISTAIDKWLHHAGKRGKLFTKVVIYSSFLAFFFGIIRLC